MFVKNCCDGAYNSFDVHFTSACDNRCEHCIDNKYQGLEGVSKVPNVHAICKTILKNRDKIDDVLFLGGEPCLYLEELVECVQILKASAPDLKLFVTTSVPKVCYDRQDLFCQLLEILDGINLSVQHNDEGIADTIRGVRSKYDRQAFYRSLILKDKIRINLNIVKPYLFTSIDIYNCLKHYDAMGFSEIKLSEIQHGAEHFVSFEDTFKISLGSPYSKGCQTYFDAFEVIKTPLLLKRSCFLCEDTLKASPMDFLKLTFKLFNKPNNTYGVVYGDGTLSDGWR